ncbi:MAG: bifunctional ornithine acetyltransferase/N-acetylglutamate synthase, partial [Gammaproteobacteria bacterium]
GLDDVALIELAPDSRCTAVFTRNAFQAAPVIIARDHLGRARPRYWLINAGNANAGTGDAGIEAASACCNILSRQLGCSPEMVLPFSTGVIGETFPTERLVSVLPQLADGLDADGWESAARAIMTTDTVPKGATAHFQVDGKDCTVTGIAKGSGMICPDMATMLAFLATDARLDQEALNDCLQHAVARTFNRITVDGDTSTNDACVLAATGEADSPAVTQSHPAYPVVAAAVARVCESLAQAIVRDAEGATRFVTVDVDGGKTEAECLLAARAVAHSPLVKTALFAADPNWGRILAAVGRCGIPDLDIGKVRLSFDDLAVVRDGARVADYDESAAERMLAQTDVRIAIDLGRGRENAVIWTSDLSHEYVTINAEYRT